MITLVQVDLWVAAAQWLGGIPYTMAVMPDMATAKKALLLPPSDPKHCGVLLTNWAANQEDLALGIRASTDTYRYTPHQSREALVALDCAERGEERCARTGCPGPLRAPGKSGVTLCRGGFQLVMRAPDSKSAQTWSFVSIFSWELWCARTLGHVQSPQRTRQIRGCQQCVRPVCDCRLALFLTAIFLTPFFFYAELDFFKRGLGKTRFPKQVGTGLIESLYRTTGEETAPPMRLHRVLLVFSPTCTYTTLMRMITLQLAP